MADLKWEGSALDGIFSFPKLPGAKTIGPMSPEEKAEFIVSGYMDHYDRMVFVPAYGKFVNQTQEFKKYMQERRSRVDKFGREKNRDKSSIDSHAEYRQTFVWPNFWDDYRSQYDPLLPMIQNELENYGLKKFPDMQDPQGKKFTIWFHKAFGDLLAVNEDV